jgi:amino acid adenylation domain-containing protein/thioester reductase-like protein
MTRETSGEELLFEAERLGATLWVEGDRLRYRATTGALSDEFVRRLKASRASVLQALRSREVPHVKDRRRAKSSFTQERLWFLSELDPTSSAYNIAGGLSLVGALDVDSFAESLNAVVMRHDVLRTTFESAADGVWQVIHSHSRLVLARETVSRATVQQRVAEFAQAPFDLALGPLIRMKLFQVDEREYVLAVSMHHTVADGWSLSVFAREVATLYVARTTGSAHAAEPLPFQYGDYSEWQRGFLSDARLERELSYWRRQLENLPATVDLPSDRQRSTPRGAALSTTLSGPATDAVRTLGISLGATPFMVLTAAVQTLIGRLTSGTDIIVGAPVASRGVPGTEKLIGPFLNTLAIRTSLAGDPSFVDVVARVRLATLDAQQHQDVPFERIVHDLNVPRETARSPIFQVLVNVVNVPNASLQLADLEITPLSDIDLVAKLDWTFYVFEREGHFDVRVVYRADVFSPDRMRIVLRQLDRILSWDVTVPLSRCSLVDDEAASALPDPRAVIDSPQYPLVADRIFDHARALGDHVAIEHGSERLTYSELDARSDALARVFVSRGCGPGDVIGVLSPRCPGLVVAMLAVFKAGGVLLGLDPTQPALRRRVMLEEARANCIVGVGSIDAEEEVTFRIDHLATDVGTVDAELPVVTAENNAYIFFTSGTTGRPKAVLGWHHGLAHFLAWQRETFDLGPSDRSAQMTGTSFDVVMRDIFTPLTAGATLCMPPPEAEAAPLEWMARSRVTMIHVVPTLAAVWLAERGAAELLSSLRWTFFAGEPLTASLVQKWRAACPSSRIANFYGPTETTLAKCFHIVSDPPSHGVQPVGRAMRGAQALVTAGDEMRACGVGEVGEITIRTPYRSRGYLNAPEETRRKFIRNPFTQIEGDLVYRTGDLGRYNPDGSLEILGRVDHQVKIRGVRVEPDEVTAALATHPAVHTCVVIAKKDEGGSNSHLIAYVVLNRDVSASEADLRDHLKRLLPPAFVPSRVVTLPVMPITANGKVDRARLPEPPAQARRNAQHTLLTTETELALSRIWRDLLGEQLIGAEDSFFELGGHSLLATQLVARIANTIGVRIPLRAVFDHPSLEQLAVHVESLRATADDVTEEAIEPVDGEAPSPLSFAQERLWFLEQIESSSSAYNMGTVVRIDGDIDVEALEHAVRALLERHEALRTVYQQVDGVPAQVVSRTHHFVLEQVAKTAEEMSEKDALRSAAEVTARPFDIGAGPVFRANIIRMGEKAHLLVISMHHIASDGWSMAVIINELAALYAARAAGTQLSLPRLPIRYADYARWQREKLLTGKRLEDLEAYWGERLVDVPPAISLPFDRPRPRMQSYRGATAGVSLSKIVSGRVRQLATNARVTPFMVLLSSFYVLLRRLGAESTIVVGTAIANRTRRELEPLVGLLMNMLPLRADVDDGASFSSLLAQVRESTLGAYAHQDLPFERIVEIARPPRDTSRAPLFQVMFVLQNAPMKVVSFPGVSLRPIAFATNTSKYDLSLVLTESDGVFNGIVEYNTDLFDVDTAESIARRYERLVDAAVSEPEAAVSDMSLWYPDELARLRASALAASPASSVRAMPVHESFEAVVNGRPNDVAIIHGVLSATYGELGNRASGIASMLLAAGVRRGTYVGVSVPRSIDAIAAVLGVLFAGAAYVPLDPELPAQRIEAMVRDAGIHVVLATRNVVRPELGKVILVDDAPLVRRSASVSAHERDAAYVIFTSGSTGRPKGVVVEHRTLALYAAAVARKYALAPGERVLQSASMSFDVWAEEVFPALQAGATLVLRSDTMLAAPLAFLDECGRLEITVANLPTAYWHELVTEVDEGARMPTRLRLVVIGGERALPERVSTWNRAVGVTPHLLNVYGPTETTIGVTWADLTGTPNADTVPIGIPIPHATAYVLDRNLVAVPDGVIGELFIGGDVLARGYIERADSTAERFLPDPNIPGQRMYRTGDLVRRGRAGELRYIGRADQQVKVRGFRIELGEIEATLASCSGVQECVAMLVRDRLIAFVTCSAPTEELTLRAAAARLLPEYALPRVVIVGQLPRTTSGKIDRRALASTISHDDHRPDAVEPRDELERRLCDMWEAAIGVRPGVTDRFFDVGGHSIAAVRLLGDIERAFGRRLPVTVFFEHGTVEAVADILRGRRSAVSVVDLRVEATLAADYVAEPASDAVIKSPNAVLLTGVTGFLGAYLLREILRRSASTVCCVVRCASPADGMQRVRKHLESSGLWDDTWGTRIEILPGDLDAPSVGLAKVFDSLGERIDAIVHNGAHVDFVKPYGLLKAANVTATKDLLALAALKKAKAFHYVSTLSVFAPEDGDIVAEDTRASRGDRVEGGYAQSKWVAEALVRAASERGLSTTIHRPGIIAGDSVTGFTKTAGDLFSAQIKTCLELRMAPDLPRLIDATPVDVVAAAVVALSFLPSSRGATFHEVHPHGFSVRSVVAMARELGYDIQLVSYETWRLAVLAACDSNSEHVMAPFRHMLPLNDSQTPTQRVGSALTAAALVSAGVQIPEMTTDLVRRYIGFLASSGYLRT